MPGESPRPPKRSRLNENGPLSSDSTASTSTETVPEEDLTRDEEFWFEDGSIVLVATKVAFKVYKGLLASQSPIFADMLATGSPQADRLMEGCPIVRLTDSPEDLRHLLRVLISKTVISVYRPDHADDYTFDQLSSLTRLAHKYGVETVEKQAVACIKTYYADTFELWEDGSAFNSEPDAGQGIGVIHLARLTDNLRMLPFAFYQCALLGGKVVRGWTREDGVVEHLDADDLARCIDGYGKLCRMIKPFLAAIFAVETSPSCESYTACRQALLDIHANDIEPWERPSLLHAWRKVTSAWAEKYDICEECVDLLMERELDARRRLWKKLPTLFDLHIEGWDSGAAV